MNEILPRVADQRPAPPEERAGRMLMPQLCWGVWERLLDEWLLVAAFGTEAAAVRFLRVADGALQMKVERIEQHAKDQQERKDLDLQRLAELIKSAQRCPRCGPVLRGDGAGQPQH